MKYKENVEEKMHIDIMTVRVNTEVYNECEVPTVTSDLWILSYSALCFSARTRGFNRNWDPDMPWGRFKS